MSEDTAERFRRPHRTRFLLHENPIAGVERRPLTHDVVKELQRRGCTITRLQTYVDLSGVDWRRLAKECDAVISAGGDGTLRMLAANMPSDGPPIGLIPRGTGNVLAEELGLTRSPARIADVLVAGPVLTFTGARANGAPFYLMAGVGFDAQTVRNLDVAAKRKWGKPAYTRPVLKALADDEPRLHIVANGGRVAEAGWILVANARRYGGSFKLSDRAGLHKPSLLVYLLPRGGLGRRLAHLTALGLGALERMPGIMVWSADDLTITSDRPVAVQVDGDVFGTVPLDIKWGEPKLALIVPQAFAERTKNAALQA